jgi:hypothetical protein
MSLGRMPHSPVSVSIEPLGDPHLPVGGAGLALLVDREGDDGGAVLLTIGMTFAKRLSGPSPSSKLTELMTARPPRHSRPGLDDGRLRRVEHDRQVEAVASRDAASRMSTRRRGRRSRRTGR